MDIDSQLIGALATLKEVRDGDGPSSLRRYTANILEAFDRLNGNQSWESIKVSAIEEPSEEQIQELQHAADEAAEWLENQTREKLTEKRIRGHLPQQKDNKPGGFNVPSGPPYAPGPATPPDLTPASGAFKCRMDFGNCLKEKKNQGTSRVPCVVWVMICLATQIKISVGS